MSRHCYTFDTTHGPMKLQFSRALSKSELEEAQAGAQELADLMAKPPTEKTEEGTQE